MLAGTQYQSDFCTACVRARYTLYEYLAEAITAFVTGASWLPGSTAGGGSEVGGSEGGGPLGVGSGVARGVESGVASGVAAGTAVAFGSMVRCGSWAVEVCDGAAATASLVDSEVAAGAGVTLPHAAASTITRRTATAADNPRTCRLSVVRGFGVKPICRHIRATIWSWTSRRLPRAMSTSR